MQGAGYFIWQLETIRKLYTPAQLARLLQQAGTGWVAWKVADGPYPYNQVGDNDKVLIEYMQALEGAGITNGGWAYSYGRLPGLEGARISERIAKFQKNLEMFAPFFLDIEVEWKGRPARSVDLLLGSIDVKQSYPVGFCSYRYPKLHPEINYARFLKHKKVKFNAPQVYWMGAHNPSEQLERSYSEYAAITDKPFCPIGSAWGEAVDGQYWEVTEADLGEFAATCRARKWETYGFWSLDWILSHGRLDWLEAIGGGPGPQPQFVTVNTVMANIRSEPEVNGANDIGDTPKGARWRVTGEAGEWWKVEGWIAKSVTR